MFSMNEFDFQSGEFLDTLYTGSTYVPSDPPVTTDNSAIPGATDIGSYGTTYPYV